MIVFLAITDGAYYVGCDDNDILPSVEIGQSKRLI